jgi:hypothetical protein
MFRSPIIAKLLRYHINNPNKDELVIKAIADSLAWKHIESDVD